MKISTIWLIGLLLTCSATISSAQNYNLETLLKKLEENHPLAKQGESIAQLAQNNIANNKTTWYPQLGLNGQATYQSAVTSLPIKLPGIEVPTLPRDQYKITLDANQSLYDGGVSKAIEKSIEAKEQLNLQQNKTDIYNLKQQVIVNYLNILLTNKQEKILDLNIQDLNEMLTRFENLYKNKMALPS